MGFGGIGEAAFGHFPLRDVLDRKHVLRKSGYGGVGHIRKWLRLTNPAFLRQRSHNVLAGVRANDFNRDAGFGFERAGAFAANVKEIVRGKR